MNYVLHLYKSKQKTMKTTKTIPFDWELYNSNREKYVVRTKEGNVITQLVKFEDIASIDVLYGKRNQTIRSWDIKGNYSDKPNIHDLQLEYEEEVGESWVNVYENEYGGRCVGRIYSLKEDTMREHARSFSTSKLIKTINLNDL